MTGSIRIGNQTSCHVAANIPYEFALRHRFDAFEWFSDKGSAGWAEDDVNQPARQQLRRAAREADMLFSVHAPVAADPTSDSGASAIRRSIQFAGDVGAGVVNIHLFPAHRPEIFAESLGPMLDSTRAAGVQMSLENTPECSPEDFNAVFASLARMPEAQGRIGMCFDMGHANLFPGTLNDYLGYVDRLRPHVPINHWHVHENWGDRDSHLTLFTGPAARNDAGVRGLATRILKRGFRGSVVLEQWPDPPESLVPARNKLRRLLDELMASIRSTDSHVTPA